MSASPEVGAKSSFVREGVLRFYYLNDTFRTLSYKNETTVAEISEILYPKLSMGLFRAKTTASSTQPVYELLPPTSLIKDVVNAIPEFEREFLKFVVPIHVRPENTAGAEAYQAIVDTISASLPKRKDPADMQLPAQATQTAYDKLKNEHIALRHKYEALKAAASASSERRIADMSPEEVARLGVRVYSEQNIYRSEYEVMRGWMQKQGEKYNKNWQDRLFVLYQDQQDSTLLYYKKANDMKTRGSIIMSQVTDIYEGPPRCIRGENIPTIGLEVPGRTYRLSAATFEEHRQWLRALREAMDTKKKRIGQDLLPNGESQLVELTLETMPELIKLFDRFNTQFRHLLRADDAIGLYRAHRQLNRMRLLYAAIVHYGEQWHDQFQQRLLTCVYGLLRVPLDQPDVLDAIVYLAEREQMQPRLEDELVTSLDTLFDEEIEEMEQAEQLADLLKQCSTITSRLRQVQDEIVPVFPDSYDIMGKYVKASHRCVLLCIMNFVERVGIDELHMIDALELISWSCGYRADMAEYGLDDVGKDFDKVERELYLRFRTVVQTQMSSWINNLVNMEATMALEESDNIRRTSAPESLVVMIRGQLKLAEDKLRGHYLRDISCRVVGFLSQYCDQKMEYLRSNASTMGVEALCAQANNFNRMSDQLEEMQKECDEMEQEVGTPLHDVLEKMSQRFLELASWTVPFIAAAVMEELEPPMQSFFTVEWVSNDSLSAEIEETIHELLGQLRIWLLPFLFARTLKSALEMLVLCYLEKLLASELKMDAPEKLQRLKSDIERFSNIGHRYAGVIPPASLTVVLRPLINVNTLLRVPSAAFVDMLPELLFDIFGNQTMIVVKSVLAMHCEVSSSEAQEIRSRCKELDLPTTPGKVTLNVGTNDSSGSWAKRLFSSVMKSSQSTLSEEMFSSSPGDTSILGTTPIGNITGFFRNIGKKDDGVFPESRLSAIR